MRVVRVASGALVSGVSSQRRAARSAGQKR